MLWFVFSSAWIPEDSIYRYVEFKSKYEASTRMPKGFKEALETIESEHQAILVRLLVVCSF